MQIDFEHLLALSSFWFKLGPDSPHGPIHWKRVEENGLSIAQSSGADIELVRLFAIFHDCQRHDDGMDPDHGSRAAALLKERKGKDFQLDEERFEKLIYACEYHNDGLVSDDPTIGTCWDADRLDLPRVGITPVSILMSTEEGKRRAAAFDY